MSGSQNYLYVIKLVLCPELLHCILKLLNKLNCSLLIPTVSIQSADIYIDDMMANTQQFMKDTNDTSCMYTC